MLMAYQLSRTPSGGGNTKPKYHIIFLQQEATPRVRWSVIISHDWFDTTNTQNIVYETPDFSSLEGWNTLLNFTQGLEIQLTYATYHGDLSTPIGIRQVWPEGVIQNHTSLVLKATP